MEAQSKESFSKFWQDYFPGAGLPICCWYADAPGEAEAAKPATGHRCVIADLARVRRGESLAFDTTNIGCFGGKRYFGFPQALGPEFPYFLSCGIPGKLEGERYKKTPELVQDWLKRAPTLVAPKPHILFKRWDNLAEGDDPLVVIFFATPDVLSGLFTLANYDEVEPDGVICPMGAGCASIVQWPLLEGRSNRPRAVIGMFDVSARPCVPGDLLTFSVPISKFARMVANIPESFLITPSWAKVKARIARGQPVAST